MSMPEKIKQYFSMGTFSVMNFKRERETNKKLTLQVCLKYTTMTPPKLLALQHCLLCSVW